VKMSSNRMVRITMDKPIILPVPGTTEGKLPYRIITKIAAVRLYTVAAKFDDVPRVELVF
jgi:hypothetical protein